MRPKQPHWSEKDLETARYLVSNGATNEQCLETLGRTWKACMNKVRYGVTVEMKTFYKTPAPVRVPDDVIAEAAKRHLAPHRDITGMIFGDPPKGYSALERRS